MNLIQPAKHILWRVILNNRRLTDPTKQTKGKDGKTDEMQQQQQHTGKKTLAQTSSTHTTTTVCGTLEASHSPNTAQLTQTAKGETV